MLRKPRFIHVQHKTARFNGFTVYFWPDDNNPSQVSYTVARCHKSDQFCKQIARETCYHAEEERSTLIKDFPTRIAMIDHANSNSHTWDHMSSAYKRQMANKYAWVWKYFLTESQVV